MEVLGDEKQLCRIQPHRLNALIASFYLFAKVGVPAIKRERCLHRGQIINKQTRINWQPVHGENALRWTKMSLMGISHVFLKSRFEPQRIKINIADDPFIQLRGEWSAQLTLIHHSPLAIKTRASIGGLVLHRIEWTGVMHPAKEGKLAKSSHFHVIGLQACESNLHPAKAHISVPKML